MKEKKTENGVRNFFIALKATGIIFMIWLIPFKTEKLKTIDLDINTIFAIAIISILAMSIFFKIVLLPFILNFLADRHLIITRRIENSWIPVETGANMEKNIRGQFDHAILVCDNKRLSSSARDAMIEDGVPPKKTWLQRLGFEFVSWYFFLKTPGWMGNDQQIRYLEVHFPIFVHVDNVDHGDGNTSAFRIRANAEVICPGLFWYTQNGKGFENLEARIQAWVTAEAQKYSLDQYYVSDTTARENTKSAYTVVKTYLEQGVVFADLGIKLVRVDIQDWKDSKSDAFKMALQKPAEERVRRRAVQEEQETRKIKAEGAIKALDAEEKEADKQKQTAQKTWEALLAQFGGDVELAKKAMDAKVRGPDLVATDINADAIKNTGIKVVVGSLDGLLGSKKHTQDGREEKK